MVSFAGIVGRAFQAQAMIAVANTILTLVGMLILGIPHVMVLSLIVFVCSFIPVLGVVLSSIPISLVGLNEGGFELVLYVIVLILIIHAIEAYILNPKIYGAHLRMNPVIVLVILLIGEHLAGVWGLLLGVPVCYYLFTEVLRAEGPPAAPAAGTLSVARGDVSPSLTGGVPPSSGR
ncbi:MAG: AI-2E family transporter [Planctomycetes bacterium]|nr:AI-2E family transporter [Planctomycetota bacterium]